MYRDESKRAAELATFGLNPEDFPDDGGVVGVWPDNWSAFQAFDAMGTQWRMGPAGPTGLDYGVLPTVMRLAGVARAQWQDTFECLRILEEEAMATLREGRG